MSTEKDLISLYHKGDKEPENTSSHVKVSCRLLATPPVADQVTRKSSSKSVKKYQWSKIDKGLYEKILQEELQKDKRLTERSVELKLEELSKILHKATKLTVPYKLVKLKGQSWRASPKVKDLLGTCKQKYKLWVESGKTDENLRKDNIQAKRNLRKQLRKEKFDDRKNFYEDLMCNPTTEKFYQLIRRNRGSSGQQTSSLLVEGKELYTSDSQRKAFAKYYEELSIPKDKGYDSAFLELCNVRHELINQICKESSEIPEPVTPEEVGKTISQLNMKKAPDVFGLTAEHLKYAGSAVVNDISNLFNQILLDKKVPEAFKMGILTPVLKKSKDSTNLDNYRGITVTPIIGKLFETVLLPRLSKNFEQSSQQYGFTKGLPPVMSALIVSGARAEAKLNPSAPLFLMTLDSQKAFDIVNHTILLDKLYEAGVHPSLWSIVKDMYSGLTSKVKWMGELSEFYHTTRRQTGGLYYHPFYTKPT